MTRESPKRHLGMHFINTLVPRGYCLDLEDFRYESEALLGETFSVSSRDKEFAISQFGAASTPGCGAG